MQPVNCCMSALVASSMSSSAITSETAKHPPGRRARAVSEITGRLSPEIDHVVRDDDFDGLLQDRPARQQPEHGLPGAVDAQNLSFGQELSLLRVARAQMRSPG